jgi:hypothetical protein
MAEVPKPVVTEVRGREISLSLYSALEMIILPLLNEAKIPQPSWARLDEALLIADEVLRDAE